MVMLRPLRILEPCSEDWSAMRGDDRERWCDRCKLHVTNVSELTRAEAEEVLSPRSADRRCVRVERDAEGSVITRCAQEERFLNALRALAARRSEDRGP